MKRLLQFAPCVLAFTLGSDLWAAPANSNSNFISSPAALRERMASQLPVTKPDYVVFVPTVTGTNVNDTGNEHFLVFDGPDGSLMAVWTQSSAESQPDQHITFARSTDEGRTWSTPRIIAGPRKPGDGHMASWGYPLVSRSGRIYVLYSQHIGIYDSFFHHTGWLHGIHSDDNGQTWSKPQNVPVARSIHDNPDTNFPPNMLCWQKPLRLGKDGKYLAGFTRWTSFAVRKNPTKSWISADARVEFMRFENVDDNPEVGQLKISWFAANEKALAVPFPGHPEVSACQEPTLVKLPDERLFCVMRTASGSPFWSVSADGGETWTAPRPLLRKDGGKPLRHPLSPCPIYDLGGNTVGSGRYALFIHNHDGNYQGYRPTDTGLHRRPVYLVWGRFQAGADQPVWFEEPEFFMDHGGVSLGKPGTSGRLDLALYSSWTVRHGKAVLWYPDRKFFLLGRLISGDASAAQLAAGLDDEVQRLAREVRDMGWVAYGARAEQGDWDLFLCRPDGSQRRNLTATPGYNEFSPQFSRDGRRLLYRRLPRSEAIDNNHHGTQGELVLANSDGTEARAFGKAGEYTWASWSPDGSQIACLSVKGFSLVEVATRQVVRTLERKGFFQQVTWSPDGQWLCGVANSFGASWSIARMNLATGAASAINLVDCCTPDWFPDSKKVIFSWRPPGQKANKGYGWTQLWMAEAEGKARQLVYGEDGRHVYGGHVSPDGRYVLFTGNMNEDGDPGKAGAPMGLMRLSDAPIIVGESKALRAVHPQTKAGPVLTLPAGWEPCWTASEIPSGVRPAARENDTAALAREVHNKGWIAYSAKAGRGDWDLFVMRPDGSDCRRLTDTPDLNEAGVRFSPDGKRFLHYRMPKAEPMDNNTYGTFELVIANADGGPPVVMGSGFPWASWGPDGTQVVCLTSKAVQIVDVATHKILRELPRKGIIQQLAWSPNGKWIAGTANGLGPFWNIGRLNPETGECSAVSETERYNCTPDWLPDSQQVLYARGIVPQQGGRAELWVAQGDGSSRRLLYAEEGRHIYGGCASPDGQYLLFTRSVEDLGKVDNSRTTMALIRWSDTPMIGDSSTALRKRMPGARIGPRLDLDQGWEPHWTYAEMAPAALVK